MKDSSIVTVIFDQISQEDFLKRLNWDYLVKAWSKTINWENINPMTIRLYLAGLDGLESIVITRRKRGEKIFIGAYNNEGELVQTGLWEYDAEHQLAVCYRKIYKTELAHILQDRLVDFCCSTFLNKDQECGQSV
jgi:hypothetical protein